VDDLDEEEEAFAKGLHRSSIECLATNSFVEDDVLFEEELKEGIIPH
jgi:hypothetical protein